MKNTFLAVLLVVGFGTQAHAKDGYANAKTVASKLITLAPGTSLLGDLNGGEGSCMFWIANRVGHYEALILRGNGKAYDSVNFIDTGRIYYKTSAKGSERKITYYLKKQPSGGFATLSILTWTNNPSSFRVSMKHDDGKKPNFCHFSK